MLTEADRKILPLALRGNGHFHVASRWYLRGFDPLNYQYAFHQIEVPNVTWVAGIASGKTIGVASSYTIDCITIPHFKALNTSVTAKQANLVFDMVMGWIEGNPRMEHLIEKISLRPFPIIYYKNYSRHEFRTAGIDARFIRGSEYDRIAFDEAGLDPWGEAVKVLRGRLRGKRVDGADRMARLDVITSPTDAMWLRERFFRGRPEHHEADLELYRSMRTETYDNTRLKPIQIKAMEADYPPEMIDVELRGFFPDYGYSMFPTSHMDVCTRQELYDAAYIALHPEDENAKPLPGYKIEEDPRHGITRFELPWRPGRIYVEGGDPGTDNPPKRNSPVVMVFDVTEKPYTLVYFDWIAGMGSYKPFLNSYKYAIEKYQPILKGVDATGPQKALDELGFESHGIQVDNLNFSSNKDAMLNALRMAITGHYLYFPPIKGLRRQMGEYTRERDKKLAQDIVMTLAEIAYLARFVPSGGGNQQAKKDNYRQQKKRTSPARGRNHRRRRR